MVLQALALYLQGEKERAWQVISEVLTLAEPDGFIRLFVDKVERKSMRSLIADFRSWLEKQSVDRAHPFTNYVKKILAAFAPSEAVVEVDDNQSAIRIDRTAEPARTGSVAAHLPGIIKS